MNIEIEYNKEYNYEDVKDIVRQKQLYILDSIVEICERHGLTYWLDGGTLLGAVRHKGFIPWDDDIDIGLMREDYEQLVTYAKKELPNDLIVQDIFSDSKYKLPYMQIRDKYSLIEDIRDINGIFIDIFPFDMMPRKRILQKLQLFLYKLFEATFIHTDISDLNISRKKDMKSKFQVFIMKIFSFCGSFLGIKSYMFFYKSILFISKISPSDIYGDGLTASWAYYKSMRTKKVYLPVKKYIFEHKEYYGPNNYNAYLKSLYGKNYMTPIKNSKQHIKKVIFLKKDENEC